MKSKQSGRRRFLKDSAALVGLAAGGVRLVSGEETTKPETKPEGYVHFGFRSLGGPSPYEKLVRAGELRDATTPLQDLQGIITPSNLHFVVNHEEGGLMYIDPQKHRLMIYGLVDRPLVLTMTEVKRLPSVSRIHVLECNGNSRVDRMPKAKTVQQSHGLASCSEWTGVLLSTLLKEVGVRKEATWVLAGGDDPSKHTASIPMEKAMDDAL